MISKTLSVVSVMAAFVCIVNGYRTSSAESHKYGASSEDELADLKLAFSAFDTDQSGHIDAEELKEVLTAVGQEPTESQLKEIMKLADEDGNGEISLPEFIKVAKEYKDIDLTLKKAFKKTADESRAWLTNIIERKGLMIEGADENGDNQYPFSEYIEIVKNMSKKSTTSEDEFAELKLVFSAFDKDESGHITEEELKDVLTAIGHAPTESQLKEVMQLADEDNNGEISLSEFIKVAKECSFVDLTLRKTFNEMDTYENGFITADELNAWLTKLGKKIAAEEIVNLISYVYDDEIPFSGFVEVVKTLS